MEQHRRMPARLAQELVLPEGERVERELAQARALVRRKLVVLDDDPTWVQTVHGVPVWRTGAESKFPGLPYVIFPGNVGGETTLRDVVRALMPA